MPLDPPPLDEAGDVVPHNHLGIADVDWVIRRVSPHHLVDDPKTGGKRLSSMAFHPSSGKAGGMSVDLQALIEAAGFDARKYVITPPWIGAVRFVAGALRAESLLVGWHPLPGLPYHGEVWGLSKKVSRKLTQIYEIFVPFDERIT